MDNTLQILTSLNKEQMFRIWYLVTKRLCIVLMLSKMVQFHSYI